MATVSFHSSSSSALSLSSMLATNVHPKLGCIVATTKPDKVLSITVGEFSVLESDGGSSAPQWGIPATIA